MEIYRTFNDENGKHITTGTIAPCGAELKTIGTLCFSSDLPASLTCPTCADWCDEQAKPVSNRNGVTETLVDLKGAMSSKRLVARISAVGLDDFAKQWQEELEAERVNLADYDATVNDASIYGQ
jgi:hypothetical protein